MASFPRTTRCRAVTAVAVVATAFAAAPEAVAAEPAVVRCITVVTTTAGDAPPRRIRRIGTRTACFATTALPALAQRGG